MNPKCKNPDCGKPLKEVGFVRDDDDVAVLEWSCRNKGCPKCGHIVVE